MTVAREYCFIGSMVAAFLLTQATRALGLEQQPIPTQGQAASKRASADRTWPIVRLATLQLVPSPLLVAGSDGPGFGVRWQLTPFAYSFGITERRLRYFLIAPVARHAGAIELYASPEWTCCSRREESGWMARLGTRIYLPAVGRGEVLALSLGGSYTYENRRHGGAAEFGIYTFSSIVGLSVTVAPWLVGREVLIALSLRYY